MTRMQSVPKITIFGLNMMVKSGLDLVFEIPPLTKCRWFLFKNISFYEVRKTSFPHREISKQKCLNHFSLIIRSICPLNLSYVYILCVNAVEIILGLWMLWGKIESITICSLRSRIHLPTRLSSQRKIHWRMWWLEL